jgi:hypothetical protein
METVLQEAMVGPEGCRRSIMGEEEAPQGPQEGVRGYEDGLGGC